MSNAAAQLVRFKHSGNLGDIIYALPSIKKYCSLYGRRAEIVIVIGAPMWLPSNLTHPSGSVMVTKSGAEMLKPLLLSQAYIDSVVFAEYAEGSKIPCDIDLDTFRQCGKFNLAMGHIGRYYQTILGFAPDLEPPWLSLETTSRSGDIVIARSSRYRNPNLDYSFLRGWNVKFMGVKSEYDDFLLDVPDAEHVTFDNFLDLATFIAQSRLIIANQTFIYSIAEALKVDRILEPCLYAGNVIPVGGNNFEAFDQRSFELAARQMAGRQPWVGDNVKYLTEIRPWHDYLEARKLNHNLIDYYFKSNRISEKIKLEIVVDCTNTTKADLDRTLESFVELNIPFTRIHISGETSVFSTLHPAICSHPATKFSELLNDLVNQSPKHWFICAKPGDEFCHFGLSRWAVDAATRGTPALYYADEDIFSPGKGYVYPNFKTDFNPDFLYSFDYIGRFIIFSGIDYRAQGGFDFELGSAIFFDFVLRYFERKGCASIVHFPEITFHGMEQAPEASDFTKALTSHMRRKAVDCTIQPAALPNSRRVVYNHVAKPLVSIIIPTKNQQGLLSRCIESIVEKTQYKNYEILIIDNQSTDPEAIDYLEQIDNLGAGNIRVLTYPHKFNFSAINNLAADQAHGEYLVLLNNDTAVLRNDWLDALLNHAQRPEVGMVGAKLLFPNAKIQHGGITLGLRGPADHPFIGEPFEALGYSGRLQLDQQYSAVTAACLIIRKSIFFDVGGMDEAFSVSYNDVDLCLKVRQAGYAIIWTPYALLMHVANVSQNNEDSATRRSKQARFAKEKAMMYEKWLDMLIADPFYNRNLKLSGPGFEVETDPVYFPPFIAQTKLLAHHGDLSGSGYYRVIEPASLLLKSERIIGACSTSYYDEIAIGKIAPDSIILQRQIEDHQYKLIERYRKHSKAKLIFEIDDYLPDLPRHSVHKSNFGKDTLQKIRRTIDICDRVVVSTPALKSKLDRFHQDIVVLSNYLSPKHWKHFVQTRSPRRGDRPRVGWAGGIGHIGDLSLIASVVNALVDRVDWVFFGLLPEGIDRYAVEFHPGVTFADYPAKLASLDLDLAIAPLEENIFNECKSNLRILEYGFCAFPVIATDCQAYRCGLPVTLVRNRHKDWVAAIEDKIANLDPLRGEGLTLQQEIRDNWMLAGDNLVNWKNGWLL